MTAIARAPAAGRGLGDAYLRALALVLVAYAVLGKGFAYVGAPPLYVGEVLFIAGLFVLFRTGCVFVALTALPNLVLLVLSAWVLARTIPFLGVHGTNALRDSVVVLYGAFAIVLCALLIEKPSRLGDAFRFLGAFATVYGAAGGLLFAFNKAVASALPSWPGAPLPIMFIRSGEVASHLAGAALYALLLRRRVGAAWAGMLLLGIGIIAAQSRGGMLAMLLPIALAAILAGEVRRLSKAVSVVVVLLAVGLAVPVKVPVGEGDYRAMSAEQFIKNAASIFDDSASADLAGTKRWRLLWWEKIEDYTIRGPYFWTGKGFGIGLAEDDGFVVGGEDGEPLVRSPHNVSITMLARAGVPGLVLWLLLLASWFAAMLHGMTEARRRGEQDWADAFLFLAGYLLAILVNASFDVALEGPMLGIWFWTLFGLGVGASMIYRTARSAARGGFRR